MGLKAGGEMPHSGTATAATTSTTGGDSVPQLSQRPLHTRQAARHTARTAPAAPLSAPLRPIRSGTAPAFRPSTLPWARRVVGSLCAWPRPPIQSPASLAAARSAASAGRE